MTTIAELRGMGPRVVELAAYARAAEILDDPPKELEGENLNRWMLEVMSEENLARYRAEFAWIPERLAEFTGIDDGDNDAVAASFESMVSQGFGYTDVPNGTDANSGKDVISEFKFDEYGKLSQLVDEEHGAALGSFADNFLLPLPEMSANQARVAQCLANTARTVNQIYEVAREDAATLAHEAAVRFKAIADGGPPPDIGVALGIAGLVVGIIGFFPVAATAAGVAGLGLGIAGFGTKPPEKKEETTHTVKGSTVSEVELSLSSALDKIVSHMDDGENVLREFLMMVNDELEKPEVRKLVVAPEVYY